MGSVDPDYEQPRIKKYFKNFPMKNGSSFSYAKTMPSREIGSNLQLVYFNLTPSNVSKLWCVFFELIAFKMNIGFPTLQSNPYSFSIAVQSWKISCHHFQSNMSPTSAMTARLVTKTMFSPGICRLSSPMFSGLLDLQTTERLWIIVNKYRIYETYLFR